MNLYYIKNLWFKIIYNCFVVVSTSNNTIMVWAQCKRIAMTKLSCAYVIQIKHMERNKWS